jgi:hypothetical protein
VSAAPPVKVPLTPLPCPPEVLGGLEVLGAEDPAGLLELWLELELELELEPDPLDGGGASGKEPAAEATVWLVLVW